MLHLLLSRVCFRTALARWRAVYVDRVQETKKRPYIASECTGLKDSLYYRRQIVHEISRKIAQIQNPSLGEYKLRDLNDDINKLIREKSHWEDHIKNLGGPDFKAEAPKMLEKEGKEVPGNRGYRYYGAARDLPGVRELFEEDPQPVARKSRGELMKLVDVSYYGNCDEDDGVIVPQEAVYEQEAIAHKVAEWKYRKTSDSQPGYSSKPPGDEFDELDEDNADTRNIYDVGDNPADIELMRLYEAIDENNEVGSVDFSNAEQLVALINDDENADELDDRTGRSSSKSMSSLSTTIEAALVAQRKREILEKYMSRDLLASMAQTGEILGIENSDEVNANCQAVNDNQYLSTQMADSSANADLDTNKEN
ncbi:Pre-mRNA-splicing factor ISY1 like [Schistosoma japonicum]|nr:Pre-mRNA-splicing factor ISY1 like [Schistosoma japonicum]